jgi:hypothetical protein
VAFSQGQGCSGNGGFESGFLCSIRMGDLAVMLYTPVTLLTDNGVVCHSHEDSSSIRVGFVPALEIAFFEM